MTETYRDFAITPIDPPGPTSLRWQYVHCDYDGPEDKRIGVAASIQECKDAIDDMLWEPECEACQGSGRVQGESSWSVDTGTKWQRNYVDKSFTVECPECSGKGSVAV
jgi:hypothetical protein